MVTDCLANARLYRSLSPAIARAFEYVERTDFAALADGTHVIDGEAMFALVQRYASKPLDQGRWEAHRRHIDLQFVASGRERIGRGHISQFTAEPYDAERDIMWLTGNGDFITIDAGSFTLFWPDDVHMPGIVVDGPEPVLKVVVKIAVD